MRHVSVGLAGDTFWMAVIARFPQLDPPPAAGHGEVAAVTTATPMAPVGEVVGVGPQASSAVIVALPPKRSRSNRPRFPTASTFVLAILAAVCWVAVWREEQKRSAEELASRPHAEDVALEPESPTGLIR